MAITPEQMERVVNNFEEVRFFDHHQISEETYAKYHDHPNVKEAVFREDQSGAGILYIEYLKKGGNNTPEFAKLAHLGNCYDLWWVDHKDFAEAFKLNDLFWILGFFDFEKRFINGFDGFTDREEKLIEDNLKKIEAILDKSPMEDLDGGGFIIMPADRGTVSHLTFMIPDYHFYYIISYDERTNLYSISARTRDESKLVVEPNLHEKLVQVVESNEMVTSAGGHKFAGGVSFIEGIKVSQIMDIIRDEIHPLMDTELK